MKNLHSLWILTTCLSALSLHADQTNTTQNKQKKPHQNNAQKQANTPPPTSTNNQEKSAQPTSLTPPAQKSNQPTTLQTPADQKNITTPTQNLAAPANTSQNSQPKNPAHKDEKQQHHPMMLHATRILPKKTMVSLNLLIQGLPEYSKNLAKDSAISSDDIQKFISSLQNFAQAIDQKHPYLEKNGFKPSANLDEPAILAHIKVILQSLPWYIQNPKVLATNIDLKDLSKKLNTMHTVIQKNLYAKLQTLSAQKSQKKSSEKKPDSKPAKDVHTASMPLTNDEKSDDQKDMAADSDGSTINQTISAENSYKPNTDTTVQALTKHSETHHVTNKNGKILGSYKRTKTKNNTFVGKFTPIEGKVIKVAEGSKKAPQLEGVHKKAIGYVRNPQSNKIDFMIYPYTKPAKAKHKN